VRDRLSATISPLVFVILSAVVPTMGHAQNLPLGTTLRGTAVVLDGDSILLNSSPVRLWGIDAPEQGGSICTTSENTTISPLERAHAMLSEIVSDGVIECEVTGYDSRWRRPVALCRAGGRDVARSMVSRGWARDWPRYSGGEYAQQEASARNRRAGFWGMTCPGLWGEVDYTR
jgi:endonuclease YncB( thermonuclease family)